MSSYRQPTVARFLQIAELLWLSFLILLGLLNYVLLRFLVPPPWFALSQGLLACWVLALSFWTAAESRLGRFYFPLVFTLMAILPVIANYVVLLFGAPILINYSEVIPLRLYPLLILVSILIGWRYTWRDVIAYAFGITALDFLMFTIAVTFSFAYAPTQQFLVPPHDTVPLVFAPIWYSQLIMDAIQISVLILVGYFVSFLSSRLRTQQLSLERANAQLANYASTLDHLATSRERNRMARELHDTLAHTLSGITVQLETIKAYLDVDPQAVHGLLDQALESSRLGLYETRRALKELRASPLDDLGLLLALEQLATSAADRGNLGLEVTFPEKLPALSAQQEQCLYRIAQEALENVVHHANASFVSLQLTTTAHKLQLEIRDNGKGISDPEEEFPGHFGLAGMRERAALVGGTLQINSHPNQGTQILLAL